MSEHVSRSSTKIPDRPLRADAVRSRASLLVAARELLAAEGLDASVTEITQRAALGKGTFFRHFPTKEALIAAVVGDTLNGLAARGRELADAEDPAAALFEFMCAAIQLQVDDRAFCEVVAGASQGNEQIQAAVRELHEIVQHLTQRAQAHGLIRSDISGEDIGLLLSGVFQTASPRIQEQPDLWRRYLTLLFDGLQPSSARPLGAVPPNHRRFETAKVK